MLENVYLLTQWALVQVWTTIKTKTASEYPITPKNANN